MSEPVAKIIPNSESCPLKSSETSITNNPKTKTFCELEKEITEVVSSCRSLINNKDSWRESNSFHKHASNTFSTIPEKESAVALEKVSDSEILRNL